MNTVWTLIEALIFGLTLTITIVKGVTATALFWHHWWTTPVGRSYFINAVSWTILGAHFTVVVFWNYPENRLVVALALSMILWSSCTLLMAIVKKQNRPYSTVEEEERNKND